MFLNSTSSWTCIIVTIGNKISFMSRDGFSCFPKTDQKVVFPIKHLYLNCEVHTDFNNLTDANECNNVYF